MVVDPIAIFVEPVSTNNQEAIKPVAIQLGQDSETSEIVFANTDDKYRWRMAKFVVQVADMNYHELVAHLGHTHLVANSFVASIVRHLKDSHPIYRLMMPHFNGTTLINSSGATDLIAPNKAIDLIFGYNSPTRLKSLQELAVKTRLGFDFNARMPDVELKSRNVDRLKVFP